MRVPSSWLIVVIVLCSFALDPPRGRAEEPEIVILNATTDDDAGKRLKNVLQNKGFTISRLGRAKKAEEQTRILCKPRHAFVCDRLVVGLLEEGATYTSLPVDSSYEVAVVLGNDLAEAMEKAEKRSGRWRSRSHRRRPGDWGNGGDSSLFAAVGGYSIALVDQTANIEGRIKGVGSGTITERIDSSAMFGAELAAPIGDAVGGGLTLFYSPATVSAEDGRNAVTSDVKILSYLASVYLGQLKPPVIGGLVVSFGATTLFPEHSGTRTALSGAAGGIIGLVVAEKVGVIFGARMWMLGPYTSDKRAAVGGLEAEREGHAGFFPQLYGGLVVLTRAL